MEHFKISTAVKRNAVADISTWPSKLFHAAAEILHAQNLDTNGIKAIKKTVYRCRKKILTTLPKNQKSTKIFYCDESKDYIFFRYKIFFCVIQTVYK